jgi:ATP-binding cassette subfamily F protein uup
LLDRVSTIVLGLDGGRAEAFADYSQWAAEKAARKPAKPKAALPETPAAAPQKKKLSYIESREFEGLEEKIAALEQALEAKRASLHEAGLKNGRLLEQIYRDIESSEREVLYARWSELEEKVR